MTRRTLFRDVRPFTEGSSVQQSGVVKVEHTEQVNGADRKEFGIVVGVDGSANSRHALEWAISRSSHFGEVQPVTTWRYPWWMVPDPIPGGPLPLAADELQRQAETRVADLAGSVASRCCRKPIVCQAPAGPTLVTLGTQANLIVVGTRGRGVAADTLLGSVSSYVAAHATVPVAIVPIEAPIANRPSRVVVGVDGSPNSIAALAWAVRTTADEVPIEAVHAWSYTLAALPPSGDISPDVFELQARQLLDTSVVEATLAAGGTRHEIIHRLEYGDPRQVLDNLTVDPAAILVVGSRGHRGIAHLLLGSTTTGLIHRPSVTTVIVPAQSAEADRHSRVVA